MNNPLLSTEDIALKFLFDSPVYVLKEDKTNMASDIELESDTKLKTEEIIYRGSYAKKMLFIISGNDLKLSENDWELFNKTITALKLSIDDIAIIEYQKDSKTQMLNQILNELKPFKTVVFGEVGSNENTENTSILFCQTLKTLSENKDLKIEWWNSIKAFLS